MKIQVQGITSHMITQMLLEHRLSALLQLHLHAPPDIWVQKIVQRQLQDTMRDV